MKFPALLLIAGLAGATHAQTMKPGLWEFKQTPQLDPARAPPSGRLPPRGGRDRQVGVAVLLAAFLPVSSLRQQAQSPKIICCLLPMLNF